MTDHVALQMLPPCRVLVTGGCGFVGAPLCALLADRGHDVLVIDSLERGAASSLRSDLRGSLPVRQLDIRDRAAVQRETRSYRPDVIFHLAAMHFIPECDAVPHTCVSVNVDGTQSILDAAATAGSVHTVVIASTAAVYCPSTRPHSEESDVGPIDIYGRTKLRNEEMIDRFHSQTGVNAGIARLFNVFGPGETNPHLIPSILQQVNRGGHIVVGNLDTRRSYVYVDDVALALQALAHASSWRGILCCNVAVERSTDGREIIEVIERVAGRRLTLVSDPARMRASDRPVLAANAERAHRLLGWRPTTSLEEGLHRAIERPMAAEPDLLAPVTR